MTLEEARARVAALRAGRTLEVKWEGADACCFLVVHYEAEHGFHGRGDEIPFDVLSPWRDLGTRTWSEDELVGFLADLPNGTAELTA
jgi:hypothetical protein